MARGARVAEGAAVSLPLIIRPHAEADIECTRTEYEFQHHGLGEKFLSRLRDVLERIESMPNLYATV